MFLKQPQSDESTIVSVRITEHRVVTTAGQPVLDRVVEVRGDAPQLLGFIQANDDLGAFIKSLHESIRRLVEDRRRGEVQ